MMDDDKSQAEGDRDAAKKYSNGNAAIQAILDFSRSHSNKMFLDASGEELPPKVDWRAAADAISEDTDAIDLDPKRYWALRRAMPGAGDAAAFSIRTLLGKWADEHWEQIAEQARSTALDAFGKTRYDLAHVFKDAISEWPRLRDDGELLAGCIQAIGKGVAVADLAIPRLALLHGDHDAVVRVLQTVTGSDTTSVENGDVVARLIEVWAGETVWSTLQQELWRSDRGRGSDVEGYASGTPVERSAELLREFGLTFTPEGPFKLAALSRETRSAWRRDLSNTVAGDGVLRSSVAETLLWFAPTGRDRAAVFAVADLYRSDGVEEVAQFLRHPVPLVRRRASTVIAMSHGVSDLSELVELKGATPQLRNREDEAARTWLGDARIERLIETSLDAAAGEYATEVRRTRGSGEETHVAVLFERLRGALKTVSSKLEELAAETDANERVEFRLEHRIVGKAEEGAAGVGSARFSADICLLFEARDNGRRFARRASFIQAKRVHVRSTGLEPDYYPVERAQLADLAEQTTAGFMLLVGPDYDGVAMPVVPARLFLDLVERGSPSSQITPAVASRLGKSIATWLLEDVIGLWTGEWKERLVEKAQGTDGREPYLLVELIAERVPRRPDGR